MRSGFLLLLAAFSSFGLPAGAFAAAEPEFATDSGQTGGDWQLARFMADTVKKGPRHGSRLWRYTRHPNHFGDFCIWWGL